MQERPLVDDDERVYGREQIAKESSNGRAHHWKVELVGLPASIRQRFQFAEQPPRILPCLHGVLSGGLLVVQ